jgi:glutathione S-transferase
MALKLVIGNKNYSSWSMRPWMALKGTGIAFDEVVIPLYTGVADKQRILDVTRSGKVPALIDGAVTVWDRWPLSNTPPRGFRMRSCGRRMSRRAHARSVSAEMHSSFMPLRNECGMNIHRPIRAKPLSRMLKPISRASSRYGPNAGRCMAPRDRISSAFSAGLTRCSRR